MIPRGWIVDGYEVPSDSLLIPNVPFMNMIGPDERSDLGVEIGPQWFDKAMSLYEVMKAKGKRPRLMRRHNTEYLPADVIGRLLRMRREGAGLAADLLVTNPEAQDAIARGEMPSISAEFYPDMHYVWGLSFTMGEEGHFDEELHDLEVELVDSDDPELAELLQLKSGRKVTMKSLPVGTKLQIEKGGNIMTPEEMMAKIEELMAQNQELLQRIANLEEAAAKTKEGEAQAKPEGDPETLQDEGLTEEEKKKREEQMMLTQEVEDTKKEVAQLRWERKVSLAARSVKADGCSLSEDKIEEELSKVSLGNDEAFEATKMRLAAMKQMPTDEIGDGSGGSGTGHKNVRLAFSAEKKAVMEKYKLNAQQAVGHIQDNNPELYDSFMKAANKGRTLARA